MTKLEVARRQLGMALDLFLRDLDPVSVHCLTCGAGEILDFLAADAGTEPFSAHIVDTHPGTDVFKIKKLRNQYWNAFKHATSRVGKAQEDEELLAAFSDDQNDHSLYIGWHDYHQVTKRLPIAAQVFQAWYYVVYQDKLSPEADIGPALKIFPEFTSIPRNIRKLRLKRAIESYENHPELIKDPKTESLPLITRIRHS